MKKKKGRSLLVAAVLAAVLAAEIMPSTALAAASEIPWAQDLSPADPENISSENAPDISAEILSEYAMEDSGNAFTEVPAAGSVDDPLTIPAEDPEAGSVDDPSTISAEGPAASPMNDFPYISIGDYSTGYDSVEAPAEDILANMDDSGENPEDISGEDTGASLSEAPADSATEYPAEESPETEEWSGGDSTDISEDSGEAEEKCTEESMDAADLSGEDSADNSEVSAEIPTENSTEAAEDSAEESMDAADLSGEDSADNSEDSAEILTENSTEAAEGSAETTEKSGVEPAETTEKSGVEAGEIIESTLPAEDDEIMAEDPANAAAEHPVIALTDVPACGERRNLSGVVFMPEDMDGSVFDPSAYKVTMYLQLTENGEYWVKPTQAKPYFEIGEDGSFSDNFITGGSGDLNAKVLHLLLLPSEYQPSLHGFHDALSQAVDYVLVTRTAEGDVTVSPDREAPEIRPAFRQVLPVSAQTIAVDVGFYTENGSQPGGPLSMETILGQLEAVAGFADTVRFYSSGGEVQKAYGTAHDMGFSIVGTAWLTREDTEENRQANQAELDALIDNCNNGYVQAACVGSETLLRGDLTAEALIEKIRYVRSRIPEDIPVTTADSWDILLGSAAVRNACDLLMPNCYPYWGGESIDEASESFARSMESLQAAARSKQIIVSETGWPTAGQTKGNAVPGGNSAARYFSEVREWSLSTGTQVLWFDAVDEPWKGLTEEGEAGAHWGLMTNDFAFKEEFADTAFFRTAMTISENNASVSGIRDKSYSGSAVTQTPVVRIGLRTLVEGTDYIVSYADNLHAGTARMTITGKGNYRGSVTRTFKINPLSIASASVTGLKSVTYTGRAISQTPVVKVGSGTLKAGTDYTVSYANNINAGTATVTITGRGSYSGTKKAAFNIGKAGQTITVKASPATVAVGKTTTVSITGAKGKKSYKSSDTAVATVTSAGKVTAKKVGTVRITATSAAAANYKAASKTVTIKVVPAATESVTAVNQEAGIRLTWKKVTGANGYKVYRGSQLIKTVSGSSAVTYTDAKANTNGTKYTYKVVAKGTTGDSTLSRSRVIYRLSRPAVSSVVNSASQKMTIKWGRNAAATGYQIQYSTDKTFRSGNKSVTVTGAGTISKVIGGLAKGQTCYVRIRTYKTVANVKYWSAWSAVKSVKIIK